MLDLIANESKRSFIAITNLKTGYTWWSKRAVDFFRLAGECHKFAKETTGIEMHPDDLPRYKEGFYARMRGEELGEPLEYRLRLTDDEYELFSAVSNIVYDKDGTGLLLVTLIDNHGIADEVDFVTGIHNEYAFGKQLADYTDGEKNGSLVKISIDRFSHINVMYGSEYANRVLRHVAMELTELVKEEGRVYRLSGAKFVMLFEHTDKVKLYELYQRISDALAQNLVIDGRRMPLEISAGALILDRYRGDANSVKSRLTYSVGLSRQSRHGMIVLFNDEVCHKGGDSLELMTAIHQCAVKDCEGFYLCYQPIVKADNGAIMGMEALLRWKKEPYGEVSPGIFIEWLEEDPCIYDLGNWIIEQALKDVVPIAKKHPGFFVNVNISAGQIKRREFRDAVLSRLKKSGLPPEQFCMELTERCREMDLEFLSREIQFFKSQGIKVAMDDFGTGSSSLSLALKIPVDELKIDMSFVKNIEEKPQNQEMVKSIISYGKNTSVETCIEGVENQQVRDYLNQYGATWYQGYYYSRPVPIDELMKLL